MAKFKTCLVSLLLVLAVCKLSSAAWTWECQSELCKRVPQGSMRKNISAEVCKLNCQEFGSLFPKPTGQIVLNRTHTTPFYPRNVNFIPQGPGNVNSWLNVAWEIFTGNLIKLHPEYDGGPDPFPPGSGRPALNHMTVLVNVTSADLNLTYSTDESYSLDIITETTSITAIIRAPTYFGARHGLETLSQLIAYDTFLDCLHVVSSANITDKPVFKHRGLHLDTSRSFFSIQSIKRFIDGLSYNKLNIFHWHLTDTHSFPMVSPRVPKMTQYGAYSDKKVYTVAEMKDLVAYAKYRGVKVLAELDMPAHSGNGYQWGPLHDLGNLAVCVNREPWYDYCVEPPCGQLNPVNPHVYTVIGDLFKDMLDIFDNDVFHMGGDEVHVNCYNTTTEITNWMTENNITRDEEGFLKLWGDVFQKQALAKLEEASADDNMKVVMWTSELASEAHVKQYLNNSKYIIQTWSHSQDPVIGYMINNSYPTIFSNYDTWYFDCGFSGWVGDGHNWCSPYKSWQLVYDTSPQKIYANMSSEAAAEEAVRNGLILGGEAPLWTEQIDEHGMESRVWPRGSALAERLWTNPTPMQSGWEAAFPRLLNHRQRHVRRGLRAEELQPEFCWQNEGECPNYPTEEEPTTTSETPDPTSSDPTTESTTDNSSSPPTTDNPSTTTTGASEKVLSVSILILTMCSLFIINLCN